MSHLSLFSWLLQTAARETLLVHSSFWVPHSRKGHRRQAGKKLGRYVGVGCAVLRIRRRRETYRITPPWGQQWCQILSCSAGAELGCCSGCLYSYIWFSYDDALESFLWWCWLRVLMADCSLQLTFWFHLRGVRVSLRITWVRHASFLCHCIMVMLVV